MSYTTFIGETALKRSLHGRLLHFRQMLPFWILCLLIAGFEFAHADEKPFGIDKRVAWSTSRMVGTPEPPSPYILERVFPRLTFKNPVELLPVPGTDRMLVVEVDGRILTFSRSSESASPDLALDITNSIDGATRAYGFVFHPDFQNNQQCFVSYITKAGAPDGTRVSRFQVTSVDPLRIDASTEQQIITWPAGGHNGGSLQFGPKDGLLYISTGDGAPPFPPDPKGTGQDISDLLGSTLRIDVDHATSGRPYSIPVDNPFVDRDDARGEVWTYGHRNPWRMSFDDVTGHLWVGDVGWEMWEMVYRVQRGANYGWSILEHVQSVNPEFPRGPTPIVPPTAAHSHTESRSITGGYVYRGTRLPDLVGTYLYGDYVTGKIWGLDGDASDPGEPQELLGTPIQIICFGQDHDQELYVVGYDGTIHRLVANPDAGIVSAFPKKLSETGLFSLTENFALAPGVIPYDVNAAPWADGTTAQRFLALPGSATVGVHEINNVQKGNLKGEWSFPDGTVLGKTIRLETSSAFAIQQRLETQILHRHKGEWRAYSYLWNADQTDAVLSDGKAIDRSFTVPDSSSSTGYRSQTWHFASRTECLLCHTTRGGSVYGFRIEQLNRDFDYGTSKDNQLRTLAHLGLFEEPIGKSKTPDTVSLDDLQRMASPDDGTADLTQRVRSYLHVNCSHCHRRGGGGTAAIEVPLEISFEKTRLISRPTQGSFGIVDPWVVAPGDPERSILFYRMSKVGRGRMPHFGSRVIDDQGLALLREWIAQLDNSTAGGVAESDRSVIAAAKQLTATNRETLQTLLKGKDAASERAQAAIDRLLSSTSGALLLAGSLREDAASLPADVRNAVIAKGTALTDPLVRDLFEAFVPESARTKTLGSTIKGSDLLALDGNPRKGRSLFLTAEGMQCRSCHKVGDQGKELGPDLTHIGKRYSRAEILENILEPSKKIDPKFQTWLIQTDDGKVQSGLLESRTDEQVTLRDATGKRVTISADEIELMVAQKKSLMPQLQLRGLTPQDAADLLAWLVSLK
jgi:uncharacterized repeat protein (TIGR03806 family)